jgi:hypothetical protein
LVANSITHPKEFAMLFVTLVLTSGEWTKIRDAAALYWPTTPLDTQMSRQEASRRLLLSGIDQLRASAQAEQQAAVNAYAQSLQPPADTVLPTLPVGPGDLK